jgi:methyl-accepting chemotaxis protein
MAIFRNMKITHKLAAVTGVLVIGFAGVGATYMSLEWIHEAAATRTEALNEFAAATALASTKTLESETLLKDFLWRGSADLEGAFTSTVTEAQVTAARLENLALTEPQREMSTQLLEAVHSFQRVAQESIDHVVAIGLDAESGLRGTLNKAAAELDKILQTSSARDGAPLQEAATMQSVWLTMRQHEREFIARGRDIEAGSLSIAKKALSDAVQEGTYSQEDKATISQHIGTYYSAFLRLAERIKKRERAFVKLNQQQRFAAPLVQSISSATQQAIAENHQQGSKRIGRVHTVFSVVLVTSAIVVIASLAFMAMGLTRALRRLQYTVARVTAGDMSTRTQMKPGDELATLGQAFDTLLDERTIYEEDRATRLAEAEREHEELNDSVISLLHAVSQLSQRDLTVQIPVAGDVTGPVADALNQLAADTAAVLGAVTQISDRVATASQHVKLQSDTVRTLASNEREQVTQTATQLAAAASAMNGIAELAQECNRAAEHAITQTQTALATVTDTVDGINAIRNTIHETEKRIKRLGERSQEISGAVSLINSIADRTHVLALNASMQAAAAGEAGRGFAIVADEVQRLAENARQATEQIARLVNNIQGETKDALAVMNTVISQVVDGSRLAGEAGEQMRQTQESTAELVASVRQIAQGSQQQAQVSDVLRDRAQEIVQSTVQTSEQLAAQNTQTVRLLEYTTNLVKTVRVFKLPDEHETSPTLILSSERLRPSDGAADGARKDTIAA